MLGDAVRSVLQQSFPDWELIIVDDGSTDNTPEIVAQFDDPRIHYVYQANKRLPGARNTGIRAARGNLIAFLDSDDLFLPDKLAVQVEYLQAHPEIGLVAGGFIEVDRNLNVLRTLSPWKEHPTLKVVDWVHTCPFCPGVPLIRREWLEKAELFDEKMPYVEDWDLWLRMSFLGCQMAWLEKTVCYYRIHGGNMVRHAVLMKNGMLRMFEKLFSQPELPAVIKVLENQAIAYAYLNGAARAYAAGDALEGKDCLKRAIQLDPRLLAGIPPKALDSLISFALSSLCDDALKFVEQLAGNMPDELQSWSARKLLGLLHAVSAFDGEKQGKQKAVFMSGMQAFWNDPSWLLNRGLVLITLRALPGLWSNK
jgi:glycosyltransferase involved in cell wall biosynthesis